jgi:hypothetical protein
MSTSVLFKIVGTQNLPPHKCPRKIWRSDRQLFGILEIILFWQDRASRPQSHNPWITYLRSHLSGEPQL